MPTVHVDKTVIALDAPTRIDLAPRGDGTVALQVTRDGVRVCVVCTPQEAEAFGVTFIKAATIAATVAGVEPRPAPPRIVANGGH